LQIGTDLLHIITSIGDGLFRFVNIDDLELPKERFWLIFLQFLAAAHISTVNCIKMAEDRPRQPAYEFSASNIDFSSLSPDPLGLKRPAQVGVKDSYPLISGYFTAIGSCSMKTVADRHRHAAYLCKQ